MSNKKVKKQRSKKTSKEVGKVANEQRSKETNKQRSKDDCVHDDVMKQIKSGNVEMKSKYYFILGSMVLGVGMAGAVLLTVFFTNVMFYRIRYANVFDYLRFGPEAVEPFVRVFPWEPFVLAVLGLLVGSLMLRKYDFCYRRNFVHILIAFVTAIFVLGFIIDRTGVNRHVQKMGVMKRMYVVPAHKMQIVEGVVIGSQSSIIVVETVQKQQIVLDLSDSEPFTSGAITINPGSRVQAIGYWDRDVFVVTKLVLR